MAKIQKSLRKRIGKEVHTFIVEGESFHDVIIEASKLSFGDVHKCGICGSDELDLGGHITAEKNFKYAYVYCKKCKARLNFGQRQDDKNVVYLRTNQDKSLMWQPFEPQQQQQYQQPQQQQYQQPQQQPQQGNYPQQNY